VNTDIGQDYQYRQNNLVNIDGQIIDFQGIKIAGLGGSAPNYEGQNYGPTLDRGADLSDTILITHVPPSQPLNYQKADIVCHPSSPACHPEQSEGSSAAVIGKKLSNAPKAHLCGHIHNIYGTACIGPTKVVKIGTAKTGQWAEMDTDSLAINFF
jgi:Icc-related predicted phosphoesterase